MRIDPRCVVTIVFCVAVLTCPPPSLVWQVTYVTGGILEKNKDPVSEDLVVILKGSDEAAVRQLFTDSPDEAQLMLDRKKGAKFQVRSLPFAPHGTGSHHQRLLRACACAEAACLTFAPGRAWLQSFSSSSQSS